jgi:hypothetical protein
MQLKLGEEVQERGVSELATSIENHQITLLQHHQTHKNLHESAGCIMNMISTFFPLHPPHERSVQHCQN